MLRIAMPVKAMAQRFAFLLLIGAATGLLILGKADVLLMERLRTTVSDLLAPILTAMSQPIRATEAVVDNARELLNLRQENARLREENARLLAWQDVARRLEQDNARYRQLLHITSDPVSTFVSARVVGDSGSAFVRTMLLNAGTRDGVEKGQAVLGAEGLAGRIIEVGQRSSRLLLLTDLNSRIPIMLENSRYRGILAGDNSDQPRIDYLPINAQVSPGDRVITSGSGGLFPQGLPIGVIASVSDGTIRVQPLADWHRLEVVSAVRFNLPKPDTTEPRAGARR